MYNADSFFTLTVPGQIGLAILSGALALGMLAVTRLLVKRCRVWLRVAIAIALFLAFNWLSPQVYYTYYRLILPGLPLQWVIGPMPSLIDAGNLLLFSAGENLSAHGRGILGWAMLITAIWRRKI